MIGFGLIGCGKISDRHIATLSKCKNASLVALCDIQVERMNTVEDTYRKITSSQTEIEKYTDVSALLQNTKVQAVVIATPSAFHASIAKQAIRSGKHVILEKPMALSIQEAQEIVLMAEEQKVVVQVCHQLRYKSVMMRTKELIKSGEMGRLYLGVVSMRLQRSKAYYEAARWRGTWEQDGGMLLNQGIHLVDLLQWFMGDYEEVYGSMLRGPIPKDTEDVAVGVVKFKDGAIGVIEANTLTYPSNYENSITLFGEKGTVAIGGIGLNEIRRWSFENPAITSPKEFEESDEHLEMYRQFVMSIETRSTSSIIHASEGKKALELIFALYESVRTNKAVESPLTVFHTNMMTGFEGWR